MPTNISWSTFGDERTFATYKLSLSCLQNIFSSAFLSFGVLVTSKKMLFLTASSDVGSVLSVAPTAVNFVDNFILLLRGASDFSRWKSTMFSASLMTEIGELPVLVLIFLCRLDISLLERSLDRCLPFWFLDVVGRWRPLARWRLVFSPRWLPSERFLIGRERRLIILPRRIGGASVWWWSPAALWPFNSDVLPSRDLL